VMDIYNLNALGGFYAPINNSENYLAIAMVFML
jgi:hypothetical protein